MTVRIVCPECSAEYDEEDNVLGTLVECNCGQVFTAEAPKPAAPVQLAAPLPLPAAPTETGPPKPVATVAGRTAARSQSKSQGKGLWAGGGLLLAVVVVGALLMKAGVPIPGLGPSDLYYCYLMLRPETQKGSGLTGYQQAIIAWKSHHLQNIVTTWEVDRLTSSPHTFQASEQIARERNNPAKKRESLNKLTTELKSPLTTAQQETFRARVNSLNLDRASTVADGNRFGIVYSRTGPKKSQYQPVDRRTIPALLTAADDILKALQHGDRQLLDYEMNRLKDPLKAAGGAARAKLIDHLLKMAASEDTGHFHRQTAVASLAQLADRSHTARIVPLMDHKETQVAVEAIAFVCRHDSAKAIAHAVRIADDSRKFSRVMDACRKIGKESEDILVAIDKSTSGTHRRNIQRLLGRIGSSVKLAE